MLYRYSSDIQPCLGKISSNMITQLRYVWTEIKNYWDWNF